MSTDRIERTIEVAATPERVWAVVTEPEHVANWFGEGTPQRIDLRPGGLLGLNHGEHGCYDAIIVEVNPPKYFSYRWACAYPGVLPTEDNSTLIEFVLEPVGEGTLLKLIESGFDAITIPPGRESASHASHSDGWVAIVDMLRDRAEGKIRGALVG